MDRINGLRSFLDTFSALYPQLQELDLRRDAGRLEVPVYMVIETHEARGRAALADERRRRPSGSLAARTPSGASCGSGTP
jgi:hypothetical protein